MTAFDYFMSDWSLIFYGIGGSRRRGTRRAWTSRLERLGRIGFVHLTRNPNPSVAGQTAAHCLSVMGLRPAGRPGGAGPGGPHDFR